MADTIRTLAALQALLADNTSGNITPQNVRDLLVSVDPEDAVTKTTFAGKAVAQKAGFKQLYTDSPILGRDNGSSIDYWGPILPLTDPTTYSWSWVNQGSASVDTTKGGIIISTPGVSGDNIRGREHAVPTAPYTATMIFLPSFYSTNYKMTGMYLRDSVSGKVVTIAFNDQGQIKISKWNSLTAISADYQVNAQYAFLGNPKIYRIKDDNTTRYFQASVNGLTFRTIFSVGRTDWITPDKIGFYVYSNDSVNDCDMHVLSWLEA